MFLNNRHYDPTTGVFISIDPLVTMTGQPYIYGAANPIRFSDPDGLKVIGNTEQDCSRNTLKNCTVSDATRQPDGSWQNHERHIDRSGGGHGYNRTGDTVDRPPTRTAPNMPPILDAPRLWYEILYGFDLGADGGGAAVCAELSGSAGVTGAVSSCWMADSEGLASLATVAAGASASVPNVSGSVGVMVSNSDVDALAEWSMCGSVSGGAVFGGSGTLCGVLAYEDNTWAYSGAWTFNASASLTTPTVGGSYTYTYTWVDRLISYPW